MGPLTLFPKLIRLFWFNRRHQVLSTLTDLICLNYLKDSSYKWSDWLCQRALVQPYFSVSVFLCWPLKHTFLYRLCDLALAGVIMVRWQLLFIELRSILIYVGSLSFFIHTLPFFRYLFRFSVGLLACVLFFFFKVLFNWWGRWTSSSGYRIYILNSNRSSQFLYFIFHNK